MPARRFAPTLLAIPFLAAACSGSRYVPVRTGVASMHQADTPSCANVTATQGPSGVTPTASVHVDACGTRTSYVCSTDTVPAKDAQEWARAKCAPLGTIRADAISKADRYEQEEERGNRPSRRGIQSHDREFEPPSGPRPTPPPGLAP